MPNVRGNPSEGLVSPWQADPKPKAEGKAKAKVKKEDGKSFSDVKTCICGIWRCRCWEQGRTEEGRRELMDLQKLWRVWTRARANAQSSSPQEA